MKISGECMIKDAVLTTLGRDSCASVVIRWLDQVQRKTVNGVRRQSVLMIALAFCKVLMCIKLVMGDLKIQYHNYKNNAFRILNLRYKLT